ncbi:hypothetical protein I4641_04820 [Waterburya agarophytonicola K14]|uniref:Uncharacterized protein n=1 Tax=Waterburya agarophytonicola KI4 TaxID=2874699 RepID=A0A964BMV2_9CYAN|nr:hypothetical protein [Waterburya agarophytonicola]MCC0176298.1 hypothetical protein [Waterburya agarophytonicola KI4]
MNFATSACRYCRFYKPEGRRGGSCQMLGVPVESSWKACTFASPPFDTTLKKLEEIFHLETSINRESDRQISSKISPKISEIKIENNLQTATSQTTITHLSE